MTKYENSIYYIFFKLYDQPFRYITTKEDDMILNVFNVVSSIYDKYKPKSKQNELERVWNLITKDPEWFVDLQKQKIV